MFICAPVHSFPYYLTVLFLFAPRNDSLSKTHSKPTLRTNPCLIQKITVLNHNQLEPSATFKRNRRMHLPRARVPNTITSAWIQYLLSHYFSFSRKINMQRSSPRANGAPHALVWVQFRRLGIFRLQIWDLRQDVVLHPQTLDVHLWRHRLSGEY